MHATDFRPGRDRDRATPSRREWVDLLVRAGTPRGDAMTGLTVSPTSRAASGPLDFAIVGEDWVDQAICSQTDPEIFFPEKGGSTRDPKKVCARCPVRQQCLQYALDHDERFGIWGGVSERARRRMRDVVPVDPDHLVESVFDTDDDFQQDILTDLGEAS